MKYSYEAQLWEDWEGYLEFVENRVEKAYYPYQAVPDYMEWFHRFSHPFAVNHEHITTVVHEDENFLVRISM
ncbi:hypothetical protein Scep_012304 [Stephania cephalantha]|uniref:Uncharacterized protein n=1 Tax=Stephania cephalantha TaxID=152367 RepID=A0AAP0P9Q7_9MAGN